MQVHYTKPQDSQKSKNTMHRLTKRIGFLVCGVLFTLFYCEFLIYYIVVAQCNWIPIKDSPDALKALIISDTHLLGPRKSFWIDKWMREWEIHQSFKAVIAVHEPEVVFVLGDIFDEGEFSTDEQFNEYVDRFHKAFELPHHIPMYITVGNHDIGFHNNIRPGSAERFAKQLNSPSVQLITLKNNVFVLLNSMALEGDNCRLWREARSRINNISVVLNCAANHSLCEIANSLQVNYSRPILLQHFPLYRLSDAVCSESDAPPLSEKFIPFRSKIDALSKEATDDIISKIKPRVVFGGHTHYGCLLHHSYINNNENVDFFEYSVPSFSMRNILQPKYMLVTITPDTYEANKCSLPNETSIIITAITLIAIIFWISYRRNMCCRGMIQMKRFTRVT